MSRLDIALGKARFGKGQDREDGIDVLADFASAASIGFEVVRGGDGTVALVYDAGWFDGDIAPLLLDGE